ncbi:MAG: xanthine dehydrogenase family protein molybdopterin-binding subunit [Synergistota bacterium]|nr:xanthine dehydrogenase family protein molybdopterin-binding subunit [Synergistota bacterium]
MFNYIGKDIPRVDAKDKVTGKATYIDDIKLHGMLYGKVLHSTEAHAIIRNIDVSAAKKIKGVIAIVTGQDIDFLGGEALKDMPFLANKVVRYVGEPVVAVAANSEQIACEALSKIVIEYEKLPAALDIEDALNKVTIIHPDLSNYKHIAAVKTIDNTNICNHYHIQHGDIEKGFSESDSIFEDEYYVHDVHHAQIEPYLAIAQVMPDGIMNVWTTNSSVHRLRKDLSDALRISENSLRIMTYYIGGSFGGKGGLKVEPLAIALAMKTEGLPVKVTYTREECFESTLSRHAVKIKIKTGVKNDGTIMSKKMSLYFDTGAYSEKGPTVCIQGTDAAPGPYRIPNVEVDGYCIYTNKSLAGAYRGYGCTQPVFANERQMDKIAQTLGIDPVSIRKRNILREGEQNALGHEVFGVGIEECLNEVEKVMNNEKVLIKPDLEDGILHGRGYAVGWEPTKTPSGSGVYVTMNYDSSVIISLSSSEVGQGSRTVLSQIAAEALNLPMSSIRLSFPNTDISPFDASTTASRTTFHMGTAIVRASEEIISTLKKSAAEMLGVPVEKLQVEMGKIFHEDDKERQLTYTDVIRFTYGAGGNVCGKYFYYPAAKGAGIYGAPSIYWMFGAHAVDVYVDTKTGKIEVGTFAAANNVGKAINPATVKQQIEGSVVMGLSNSFYECIVRENGKILNPNFHDYKIATSMDIPSKIVPIIIEVPDPLGPYGAKGVGEPAIIPTHAAVTNAVADALGKDIHSSLLRPENILKIIGKIKC